MPKPWQESLNGNGRLSQADKAWQHINDLLGV